MKVFITGASGFIGSHVTEEALASGYETAVLAAPGDDLWRLKGSLDGLQVVQGLLSETETITRFFRAWKPEVCIHLAWYAEPGKYLQSDINVGILFDSIEFMKAAVNNGCGHFIAAGSCSEYQITDQILVESSPTDPQTIYSAAKHSFHIIGRQIAAKEDASFSWGRIFYPYGRKEDPRRLIPAVIRSLQDGQVFKASKGEQTRDYLHVSDVARAFMKMVNQKAKGVFNISSGSGVRIKDILSVIGAEMNKSELIQLGALPSREWDPAFIVGDNSKLRSIGWEPLVSLEEGLSDAIHWWLSPENEDRDESDN